MTQSDVDDFVQRAEAVYVIRLRTVLEPEHIDKFVAIEPESGDYFLGRTISEAIGAARRAYPNRLAQRCGLATRQPFISECKFDERLC